MSDHLLEAYKLTIKSIKELVEQRVKIAKDLLTVKFAELFNEHAGLEEFSWTQGTPSFNDGDPCYFGVHCDEPDINGYSVFSVYEEDDECELTREDYDKYASVICDLISIFDSDDLQSIYGDNQKITVSRKGVYAEYHYDY